MGKLWIEQYGTVEITNHRYAELAASHTRNSKSRHSLSFALISQKKNVRGDQNKSMNKQFKATRGPLEKDDGPRNMISQTEWFAFFDR